MMNRRTFLGYVGAGAVASGCVRPPNSALSARRPNFVVIFADDLGYNDLGCYRSKLIKTPRLDGLADNGMKFMDFYSAAPVCTPSRAALLTGCYPQRTSMAAIPREEHEQGGPRVVLFAESTYGIHPNEITIAELLKAEGYATACVGKWHLGHRRPFLPTSNGFDSYFGVPFSNDMGPALLMSNEEVVERRDGWLEPEIQETLTERYTEEAVKFIRENQKQPFFLYMPHTFPHTPLHVSKRFRGKSARGLYGDVVECIDWSVGRVLDTLAELGVDDNTVVIFTSDNGPWYARGEDGGNATPLRSAKGTTYDGGMRVPCIMRWPGRIPKASVCSELATMMDIMPTLAKLAGTSAPTDRIIDGKDIMPLMSAQSSAKTPHEAFFFYYMNELHAVRSGKWKLKVETKLRNEDIYQRMFRDSEASIPAALYNLETDPGEQKSVLKDHPDIAKRLRAMLQKAREDLGDTLTETKGKNARPIGRVQD